LVTHEAGDVVVGEFLKPGAAQGGDQVLDQVVVVVRLGVGLSERDLCSNQLVR
jgi:hypothetical protein